MKHTEAMGNKRSGSEKPPATKGVDVEALELSLVARRPVASESPKAAEELRGCLQSRR
jgi:hypothetical protein